jgi:hypothetical protein
MLAAPLACAAASPQPEQRPAADRERELLDSIGREESRGGPYSEQLIAPLWTLTLFYQEQGDHAAANPVIGRLLQVVRANYGLYSLAQAPAIRQLIANEEATGNKETAWQLQDELLALARRHPEDLSTVAIFREIADKRLAQLGTRELPMELLCRDHGAMPPCNKDPPWGVSGLWLPRLVRAQAMNDWADAIRALLQNEQYGSPELRELEQKIINNGTCDVARDSYRRLMFYDTASEETSLNKATTIVRAADSELVCSLSGSRRLEKAALELYRQAYELLERNGVDRTAIDALFAPPVPIKLSDSLPAYASSMASAAPSSTLRSRTTPAGHVDFAFEITKYGRARRVEIVDATTSTADAEKTRLLEFVKTGLYRPRAASGGIADGSSVVWRYYD